MSDSLYSENSIELKASCENHPLILPAVFFAVIIFCCSFLSYADHTLPEPISFDLGTEEIVVDWTTDRCGNFDIPDMPTRIFRDRENGLHLFATHWDNRQMTGPDLDSLAHDCRTFLVSDEHYDPSEFNDREWIMAVYTEDGLNIDAIIHNEYHAREHPGSPLCPPEDPECMCRTGGARECWYNALTYGSSTNGGKTFSHPEPPTHRLATLPYTYEPDQGPIGIFGSSNIIKKEEEGVEYYYFFTRLEEYKLQQLGAGLFRTDDPSNPESWRCWDGEGFNVRLIDPYREEPDDSNPANHLCKPVDQPDAGSMSASVTYNTYLQKYILVGSAIGGDGHGNLVPGFYYSLSDDLIDWSPRQLFFETSTFSALADPPTPIREYPSLIDASNASYNFDFTDNNFYLYYTTHNTGLDRDLFRREVTIIDSTPPTIEISPPSANATNSGDSVTYTVTYSDATTITVNLQDHQVHPIGDGATGVVSSVTGTGNTRTVTVEEILGNGPLGIMIDSGTATDHLGNQALGAGPDGTFFTVDNTPPIINISNPTVPKTRNGPVGYTVTYQDADTVILSQTDIDVVTLDGNATGVASVEVHPTINDAWTVTVDQITGDGQLAISIDPGTAEDDVGNSAEGLGPSTSVTVDNTPPIINISNPTVPKTRNGPVGYTVTYQDADTVTLSQADIDVVTLDGNATGVASVEVHPTINDAWTVTVDQITGDGQLAISIDPGTAEDDVGNSAEGLGPSTSVTVDNTPPIINISNPTVPKTRNGPVGYTVTYQDADTVTLSQAEIDVVTLDGNATGVASVEAHPTINNAWTVTVDQITGDGQLAISIDPGTAEDDVGNSAEGLGPSTSVTVDNTPPIINISNPTVPKTRNGPVGYTVTYQDADTVTLSQADIDVVTLDGNATGVASVEAHPTINDAWTVTVDQITGDGQLAISIDPDTAEDDVGNSAEGLGPSTSVTVDNTPPIINISNPTVPKTRNGPVGYTVTYQDADTVILSQADIDVVTLDGNATGVASVEAHPTINDAWTVTVDQVTGDGQLAISIDPDTAEDDVGNSAEGLGPSTPVAVDNTPPTVSINGPNVSETATGPVEYIVNYQGADLVTLGDLLGDITLNTNETANGNFSVDIIDDSTRRLIINDITGDGSIGITIAVGTATDDVGNVAGGVGPSATFVVDNTDTDLDGEPDLNDVDDDNDGLADDYENDPAHGCLNPLDAEDANTDKDGDRLTSLEEFNISVQLNPCDADSDGDKIDDLLDSDPLIGDNVCSSSDEAIFIDPVAAGEEIQCGAAISITVSPEVDALGLLRLISPKVIFNAGGVSGKLKIDSSHPCSACSSE